MIFTHSLLTNENTGFVGDVGQTDICMWYRILLNAPFFQIIINGVSCIVWFEPFHFAETQKQYWHNPLY